MTVLRLRGVSVAYAAKTPLFDSVSLTLEPGFYGLIGPNGAGKTTLLSVLCGELTPQEGTVVLAPRGATVTYCRQRVDERDASVDALALREDGRAAELRGRLGLEPSELERWNTLSPGERKRWQIAAALSQEPDVLLLDEPTNHLDVDARKRLLQALRRFSGLAVMVSHDRSALDALTTSTLRIVQRRVTLWPGNFSEAKNHWERAQTEEQADYEAARDRVRLAAAQLDAARRSQASGSKNSSTSARMKNKNDSDARGILATTKAQWADARAGRVTASARNELERAQKNVPVIEREATLGGKVFATYERATKPVLFHLNEGEVRRGDHVVLRDVRVSVGREDRVRLEGENGAGKTTLLEALLRTLPQAERVLYLPQEVPKSSVKAALGRLRALGPDARGRLMSVFAALGSEPERVLRGDASHLSPGEERKLVLAEALARQVWALVMDEPTNHLDLPSVERLEAALSAYPGCIVLVTHDDVFAQNITTRSLQVRDGTVT